MNKNYFTLSVVFPAKPYLEKLIFKMMLNVPIILTVVHLLPRHYYVNIGQLHRINYISHKIFVLFERQKTPTF